MNRITETINKLQKKNSKAFIPFITTGYPSAAKTVKMALALDEAGADILELGIPFSDPMADGPVIQECSQAALDNGTVVKDVFDCIKDIRKKSQIPIIAFTYSNIVYSYGIEKFMRDLNDVGGDGILIPDIPLEESEPFQIAAHTFGLSKIFLVSPLSDNARLKTISAKSDDFVYCVSVTGVTGARNELSASIEEYLSNVRKQSDKPFVVGFGISNEPDAERIAQMSDGIVIGSALLNIIKGDEKKCVDNIRIFAEKISARINRSGAK